MMQAEPIKECGTLEEREARATTPGIMGILFQFLLEVCLPTPFSPTSQQSRATDLCLVKKKFYHWVECLGNTEILV